MNVAEILANLRKDVDYGSYDVAYQQLYEHWLKREEWPARVTALPLIVGVDPTCWKMHLDNHDLAAAEGELWSVLKKDRGDDDENQVVPVSWLVEWARREKIELPASFVQLYDFIRRVTLVTAPPEPAAQSAPTENSEAVTVLGAALSLVSKMPDRCRDKHGFIDGAATAKMITEMAARWFPPQGPAMSEADMAALIDSWLE